MKVSRVDEIIKIIQYKPCSKTCEGCKTDREIFKEQLLSHILAEMPSTSSTLKLSAKEKFIWLSGVKDCVDKLKEIMK